MGGDFLDLEEAIKSRRSIRRFRPDPVHRELVEQLIHSATWAPSGMNEQQWSFYVVTGSRKAALIQIIKQCLQSLDERLHSLFSDKMVRLIHGFFQDCGQAPVIVIALCRREDNPIQQEIALMSTAAAIQNLLLLAHADGLGSCWMSGPLFVQQEVMTCLGADSNSWRLVATVPIGYPDQAPPAPPRRPLSLTWLEA